MFLKRNKMNGGLPDSSLIEKLINEDYYKNYGTNGSEESREQRLIGAKFIITWLVNNQVGEEAPKEEKDGNCRQNLYF